MFKKILLLTKPNFDDAFVLAKAIQGMGHSVDICSERPAAKWYKWEEYDLVLSYFYPFILKDEQLDKIKRGINCHISYLPYNRGAMPNIWAIVDKTPAGVTIHELDTGIDTGRIIAQHEVPVYIDDTGYSLYNRLCETMLKFTLENLESLIEGQYDTVENEYDVDGTIHYVRNLDQLRDLSNRFSQDELAVIMDALDIIRACSFNGKYPGAYIPFISGTKLYIDDIKLRVDETDKVEPTKEDFEWAERKLRRIEGEAHLNDRSTPMSGL